MLNHSGRHTPLPVGLGVCNFFYPNPVNDFLEVLIPRGVQLGQIQLFYANGNLIYQEKISNNLQRISLDLTTLPNGLYFVGMIIDSEKIPLQKLIKIKN